MPPLCIVAFFPPPMYRRIRTITKVDVVTYNYTFFATKGLRPFFSMALIRLRLPEARPDSGRVLNSSTSLSLYPENYTFALFGKDGATMDKRPLVFVKFNDHGKD